MWNVDVYTMKRRRPSFASSKLLGNKCQYTLEKGHSLWIPTYHERDPTFPKRRHPGDPPAESAKPDIQTLNLSRTTGALQNLCGRGGKERVGYTKVGQCQTVLRRRETPTRGIPQSILAQRDRTTDARFCLRMLGKRNYSKLTCTTIR